MTGAPRGSARITRWTARSRIVEEEEEEEENYEGDSVFLEEEGHCVLRQGSDSRVSSSSSRVDRTVGYTRRGNVTSVTQHEAAAPFRLWRRERRRDERNISILRSPRGTLAPHRCRLISQTRRGSGNRDIAPEDERENKIRVMYLSLSSKDFER